MTVTTRTQRSLQALVLAGLGLFLLEKIWSGTLFWYINQRFVWLMVPAAAGLLALAALRLPRARAAASEPAEAEHTHPEEGQHAHTESGAAAVWGLLLLAVPLALGVLVPARPLGAAAIANKGINLTLPLAAGGDSTVRLEVAATERNVLDWVRAFSDGSDPAVYAGQAADVIGFVYHASGLPAGQFLVSRFALTCCAADAAAVGVLVAWPEAAGLADNSWVRVRGAMAVGALAWRPTPLIEANEIMGVAEPDQPYLYP